MKKEVIFHPGGTVPWPRAVKAGNWISIVAAGIDAKGVVVSADFEAQLDFTYSEMKKTLDSLGSSIENIVQMTIYLVDMERDLPKVSAIRKKYIPDDKFPAVAAIGTTQLAPMDPPLLVEISCSAIIPDE